jgi:hypothetical protein
MESHIFHRGGHGENRKCSAFVVIAVFAVVKDFCLLAWSSNPAAGINRHDRRPSMQQYFPGRIA